MDYSKLYRRINYTFRDEILLERALRHRSKGSKNNERLEFLGDSILGFVMAEALFVRSPNVDEGGLSRLRSNLVKGETLSEVGAELNLGDFLSLGEGELKSGGFRRHSIIEDAVEALIGAVYLDSDIETAKQVVLHVFETRLNDLPDPESLKDPKTRLQEYLQRRKMQLPEYEISDVQGKDHNQTFTATCHVKEKGLMVNARGSSRRKAEKAAAMAMLEKLR